MIINSSYPFSNHPLVSKTQRLNYEAVMTLAQTEFSPEAITALGKTLSCCWDPQNARYVALDPTDKVLIEAALMANRDLLASCLGYQNGLEPLVDDQASELLRHRLMLGFKEKYARLLNFAGLSAQEILSHYDLLVSKFDKQGTIDGFDHYGIIYNNPDHRRIFVSNESSEYAGLDYLLLCFLPGLATGLHADIGALLSRTAINIIIDEPAIMKYLDARIVVDALHKNGLEVKKTLMEALQGNPEKLYGALINEYGILGLGNLLIAVGSNFTEETHGIERYVAHYGCAMEYFQQFGYELSVEGI